MVVLTWSAVFVVLALVLMGTAVWFGMRPDRGRSTESKTRGPAAPVIEERVVSQFESPSEEEALKLVEQALLIRDPAKVAASFHPGSSSPEEVVGFLRDLEKADGGISGYEWLSSMDANGLLIDGVLVKTQSGNTQSNRLALLTPDKTGTWKVDFDAFARTVKPSWRELMAAKSGEGLVRVIVAKDSYFNGPFKEESLWTCYGMASPDLKEVLLGYCRKGTPQAAAMARIVAGADPMSGGRSLNRATLAVRRSEGGESRQFEITRVLAEDWVMAAKAFDENFQ